jgi:hypothetical protein
MWNRAPEGPLFDPRSLGRRGPGQRDRLSPAQIQQIARTVARTPEVMVKVLPAGAGEALRQIHRYSQIEAIAQTNHDACIAPIETGGSGARQPLPARLHALLGVAHVRGSNFGEFMAR